MACTIFAILQSLLASQPGRKTLKNKLTLLIDDYMRRADEGNAPACME